MPELYIPPDQGPPSRSLLDILAQLSRPQQPTWEQILARRYIDALLGRNPNRTSMSAAPYYPGLNEQIPALPEDVLDMLRTTGMSPAELFELMQR